MTADLDMFLDHVSGHAGTGTDGADRAARAVLSGLGAYLPDWARELVADELPPELGHAVRAGGSTALPLEELVLARGASTHQSHELVLAVCRVLAEELSDDALRTLRAALPLDLAALLIPAGPEIAGAPAELRRTPSLASGRPGSQRPVHEAGPPEHHRDSVSDANPHGASKLSSAEGSTQEREGETLAEGEPGYDRTLAGE